MNQRLRGENCYGLIIKYRVLVFMVMDDVIGVVMVMDDVRGFLEDFEEFIVRYLVQKGYFYIIDSIQINCNILIMGINEVKRYINC